MRARVYVFRREDRCVGSYDRGYWGRSQLDVLDQGGEVGRVEEVIWLDASERESSMEKV